MRKITYRGFTLIEILIVVAIIGILASVVLVGFGPVQRRGRDARRISDLKNVQNALELYYNKCGYYPGGAQATANQPCGDFSQISTWSELTTSLTGSNLGVNNVPNDPNSAATYFYGTSDTGDRYVIGATLEEGSNSALDTDVDGTDQFGVDCGTSENDITYCVEF